MRRFESQQFVRRRPEKGTDPCSSRKGGAALIVVMSLLGTLAFLGFLFYGFAKQELANSENFAAGQTPTVPLPPDAFWDWALEQIIVGTDAQLTNSALYGNKYSLLANMLGSPNLDPTGNFDLTYGNAGSEFHGDVQPFDGAGIGTVVTGFNTLNSALEFGFDINQDGTFLATGPQADVLADNTTPATWRTFVLNFSPAADSPVAPFAWYNNNGTPFSGIPAYANYLPDAGYTYPDINSLFLAYDAEVRGWEEGSASLPANFRVIIPSYFRPQLFPQRRGANNASTAVLDDGTNDAGFADLNGDGNFNDGIYTDARTARQVLRPHRAHVASVTPLMARYISVPGGVQAQSGDTNRIIRPFPFTVDLDNDNIPNEMGVWTNPAQGRTALPGKVNYELDVDTDGDGIRDSIWIDLDFPLMTMEDGRQFVPMFAVKIIDLDSLLNVNAHGNAHGLYVRLADGSIEVFDDGFPANVVPGGLAENVSFHQSNLGLSPSEVNLSLALTANLRSADVDPGAALPPNQLDNQDVIESQFELRTNYEYNPTAFAPVPAPPVWATSNLEALMILNGRRVWERLRDPAAPPRETREQILGRHADQFKVRQLYRTMATNTLADAGPIPGPLPGGWGLDDDGDSNLLGISSFFNDPAQPGGQFPDGFHEPNADDDRDAPGVNTGNYRSNGGSYFADAELFGVQVPPFVHPLDYLGTGGDYLRLMTEATPADRLNRDLADGITSATNPMRWPSYFTSQARQALIGADQKSLWQYQRTPFDDSVPDATGVLPLHQALVDPILSPGNVLQEINTFKDFLLDEPNEVILEPEFRNPEYDGVFATHEMERLHLSAGDATKIKATGRLPQLAPVNLDRVQESVASRIRKRLTTDSWDRLEPAQTRFQAPASAAFDRQWEYTPWTGAGHFATDLGPPVKRAFPPEFGPAALPIAAGSANDPFRPEVRLLLKNELHYTGNMTGDFARYPRRKLNINRLLSGEVPQNAGPPAAGNIDRRAFDDDGNPRFRNLTPHPVFDPLVDPPIATIPAILHTHVPPGTEPVSFNNIATQKDAQEWWARYDRQRLARDIYVLLYTLGGGHDGLNPLDNTPTPPYPAGTPDIDVDFVNDNVQAMAQFAVNYVDALDRDNVITKFEYDTNLSDGWDISAANSTSDPDYAVANGVEAQSLTFSEVLWLQTLASSSGNDEPDTFWDDTEARNFLHIELRNASPFDVDLGLETWRIARLDSTTPDPATPLAEFEWIEPPNPVPPAFDDKVPAGRTYLITCQDESMRNGAAGPIRSSDIYLEFDPTPGFEIVSPNRSDGSGGLDNPTYPAAATDNPAPLADLDLSFEDGGINDDQSRISFSLPWGTSTHSLIDPNDATGGLDVVLSLQRRRHIGTNGVVTFAGDAQGDEWVEVDRMTITPGEAATFTPGTSTVTDIQSIERPQPLVRSLQAPSTPGGMRQHTLGHQAFLVSQRKVTNNNIDSIDRNQANDQSPAGGMTTWQPHFDRDFSSIFELFAVPVSSPGDLTARLTDMNGKMSGEYRHTGTGTDRPAVSAQVFIDTDPLDDTDVNAGTGLDDDNRWYRLLEFLQVPSRAEDAIRERLTHIVRTPGKLNLNTIRHEEVLAALIDDPSILKFQAFITPGARGMTDIDPAFEPAASVLTNWFDELRLARDGIDPVNYFPNVAGNRTFIPLPGIPGANANPGDTSQGAYSAAGRPQFGAIPFRSLSYLDANRMDTSSALPLYVDPTSTTILRERVPPIERAGIAPTEVIDRIATPESLRLFEARPSGDVGTDDYDFHTRHRLLAKIANNATNRSNVFAVWITVEYFEAHQPVPALDPSIVQVGAKLEGSPTHRGFFIIDRTRLERAVDPGSITNPGSGSPNDGRNDLFRFDWRDFVIHRRTIQ